MKHRKRTRSRKIRSKRNIKGVGGARGQGAKLIKLTKI